MTLKTLTVHLKLVRAQTKLILLQRRKIEALEAEVRGLHLDYTKQVHGVAIAWLLSLEKPDLDVRDMLVAMDTALADQIASLEEHIV